MKKDLIIFAISEVGMLVLIIGLFMTNCSLEEELSDCEAGESQASEYDSMAGTGETDDR